MNRSLIFALFELGLVLALIAVVLSGCSAEHDSADDVEARKICNFKPLYDHVNFGISGFDSIYVDTLTGVLYIRTFYSSGVGFSPLYNADGTLKVWEGANE